MSGSRVVCRGVPCAEVDCGDLEWGVMEGRGDEKLALGREGGRGGELVECLSNDVDGIPMDPIDAFLPNARVLDDLLFKQFVFYPSLVKDISLPSLNDKQDVCAKTRQ